MKYNSITLLNEGNFKIMPKKITTEDFVKRVKIKHEGRISALGIYKGNKTHTEHKCNVCDYEWSPIPNNVLRGAGCPACAGKATPTQTEYKDRVEIIHGGKISVIGLYETGNTHTEHKCNVCDWTWNVIPKSILRGNGCPNCVSKRPLTQDEYKDRVYKKHEGGISVIGKFKTVNERLEHKCNVCKHEWSPKPNNILCGSRGNGSGCPKCITSSRGERLISKILKKMEIPFTEQYRFPDCRHKCPLPFDFSIMINGKQQLIEHQGEQHFKSVEFFGGEETFKGQQKRDQIKRKYCKKNNIPLLEIRYDDEDWENALTKFLIKNNIIDKNE